ncbi:ATP-binding protein [candidate division KSB1 bacterium]|nr:ATP-binding protein [candidate division KSB1 bacterium]
MPEWRNFFFQVISNCYETGSIVVTTNKPFREWGELYQILSWVILCRFFGNFFSELTFLSFKRNVFKICRNFLHLYPLFSRNRTCRSLFRDPDSVSGGMFYFQNTSFFQLLPCPSIRL